MGFVGDIIGDITGSNKQAKAADKASELQYQAAQAGVDEQRRQFDALQAMQKPFVNAGTSALSQQLALMGLSGAGAQQSAISALQASPAFTSALRQGENSILQNASATGGLRGGNTQAALAQFSPALLASLINDQYGRLGGLSSLGQNAAAGVGNAGIATGNNVTQLLQQQGAARAGAAITQGNVQAANMGNLLKLGGTLLTGGLGGIF